VSVGCVQGDVCVGCVRGDVCVGCVCWMCVLDVCGGMWAPHLALGVPLAQLGLLGVVEPLHLDHHAGGPRLPEVLDASDVGEAGPAGGEEHGAVAHPHGVAPPHHRLVEELAGLPLQTPPLGRGDTRGYWSENNNITWDSIISSQMLSWSQSESALLSDCFLFCFVKLVLNVEH